jgi:nitrosocyanin
MNSRVIIGLVVALLILGGGAFFLSQNKAAAPAQNQAQVTTAPTQAMSQEEMDKMSPTTNAMQEETSPTGAVEGASVKEFTVTGSPFKFVPATLVVNKGDTVKITFKNSGGMHDLVIDEFNAATKIIQSGQEDTVEFVADKAGSFEYYCSVANHRQMGMVGTLTVK